MNSAVEAHNKRLAAAPVVKSTSAHTWKPGERAGAPSTPRDAFGFVFGISKTDAAAVCQKAGHQWSEIEGVFHCSGTPSTAITGAPAQLEFTAAGLSTVEIVIVPPKDAAGWTYMLRQSEGAMAQLYGNPTQRNFVVPDDCKPEASFLGCVADGKVTGNSLWFLDGGYVATLTIVAAPLPSPSTIHVRILLRQPPKP
jgi:hypothetical protein